MNYSIVIKALRAKTITPIFNNRTFLNVKLLYKTGGLEVCENWSNSQTFDSVWIHINILN